MAQALQATEQATEIVKSGNKAAEKAGKCAGIMAEIPVYSETLVKLEEYKQKTFGGKSADSLTPQDFKELNKINDYINKLEKNILELKHYDQKNCQEVKKNCDNVQKIQATLDILLG